MDKTITLPFSCVCFYHLNKTTNIWEMVSFIKAFPNFGFQNMIEITKSLLLLALNEPNKYNIKYYHYNQESVIDITIKDF
jgi:hypothetical protein